MLDAAGGLARFMNWDGPTFTDSGGFQVLSLGAGFKKTLAMDVTGMKSDDVIAAGKERLAFVDEDGVTFKSPLNATVIVSPLRFRWASSTKSARTSCSRSTN